MTHSSVGIQPGLPEHAIPRQNQSRAFAQQMERLALIAPEAGHLLPGHLPEYALAYIERYQHDILQMEMAWDFLNQILIESWRQERYEVVVRLAAAMALPAGRRAKLAEGEYVLRLGVVASRRLHDRQRLAAFLNRLGSLMLARGKYIPGQRVWQVGFHLAISAGSPSVLWQPLVSFAPCADIQGNVGEPQRFVETIQPLHDPASLAVALFSQGLYARFLSDLDTAYAAFSSCLSLLLQHTSDVPWSPAHQLFSMVVQTELARVQGDSACSQTCTATALALAELFSDSYTLAALLIDQCLFLYQQGQLTDLYQAYLRLRALLKRVEAPHIVERCRFLAYRLMASGYMTTESDKLLLASPTMHQPYEALSTRESEVLKLVASGLSNQEIAAQLVITPGTVKKHLEHIYTRLDVHNRTAAVARARAMRILS